MNTNIIYFNDEQKEQYRYIMAKELTLKLTANSFTSLSQTDKERLFLFLNVSSADFALVDDYYNVDLETTESNISALYQALKLLYSLYPNEANRVMMKGQEFYLYDPILAKLILLPYDHSEDISCEDSLSSIVYEQKITTVEKLETLTTVPFSSIHNYDILDWLYSQGGAYYEQLPDELEFSGKDADVNHFIVKNRIIKQKIIVNNCQRVLFENCVIESDVNIAFCRDVEINNCIITGKMCCSGITNAYITEINCNSFALSHSSTQKLNINYSKFKLLSIHSGSIKELHIHKNKIYKPYLSNVSFPECKVDMSQFIRKAIRKDYITTENNVRISDKQFYFTFQISTQFEVPPPERIATETIDSLLKYGEFRHDYAFLGDLKYKRMLYTNTGIKNLFVRVTGGFYKPWIWLAYLGISTIVFALIYAFLINTFITQANGSVYKLTLFDTARYSLQKIIGANSTGYSPTGFAIVVDAFHSVLNTTFIASFFTTVIKKYLEND